ncbi:MAG TPA: type VI secretion system baseplate subunit TssK [Bryobacteraceae bacterium]
MKSLSRVVWWEGMYLGPHHFQAQSRYFEDSIRFCVSMLWSRAFGVASYALDTEALKNGTVNLLHASGILPDGLAFNMPDSDPLPEPRNFAKLFPPTRYTLTVLLAITARRPDGRNCALQEGEADESVRFVRQTTAIADETTGHDEKSVGLGRKNFRLVLDSELTDDTVRLPIARIMRSGSGDFIPDPEFIPPCIQVGASPRLMELTGRLIEIMEEKSLSLARSGAGDVSFSTRDIASFWFRHTVNASLAPLRHHYLSKRGHPEELFLELSRLAGGLCTFALDSHPRMLPAYDHNNPDVCFAALDKQIREHLELIIPTNCVQIELTKTADYIYAGPITDERCVGRATWLLGLRSDIGEVDLITKAPQLIKICSEKFVGELVRRALPGLALSHVSSPPPAVAPRAETQYFVINRSGPFWDNIVQTRRVGIYIPGDIPNPGIDLLAVLES